MSGMRDIRDGLMAALGPLGVGGGGYVRALVATDLVPGPAAMVEAALQFPAVFVCYSSSEFSPGQYKRMDETLGFTVFAVCRQGGRPGPFEVMGGVRDLLAGASVAGASRPVRLLRESPAHCPEGFVAVSALYSAARTAEMPAQTVSV